MDKKTEVKKLPKINNKKQLGQIFDDLNEQGFGYFNTWEAHESKVNSIINKNNELNIGYDKYEVDKLIGNIGNYDEIDKITKKHFSKFKPDDKIKELLNIFYLKADATVRPPSHRWPDKKEIFEWVKFKKRWNINRELNVNWNFSAYNLDKNIIKINNPNRDSYSSWNFTKLYELLYGKKPEKELSNMNYGDWQDLGEIQVKVFKNGTMNIKGNIKEFKKYLYNNISRDCLIIYNNKREIREKS